MRRSGRVIRRPPMPPPPTPAPARIRAATRRPPRRPGSGAAPSPRTPWSSTPSTGSSTRRPSTPMTPANQSNAAGVPHFDPTPPSPVSLIGDYASNGTSNLLIDAYYKPARGRPQPVSSPVRRPFPTATAITITLNKTTVLAKDGRTSFVGVDSAGRRSDGVEPAPRRSESRSSPRRSSVSVTTPPPPPKAATPAPTRPRPSTWCPTCGRDRDVQQHRLPPSWPTGPSTRRRSARTSPPRRRRPAEAPPRWSPSISRRSTGPTSPSPPHATWPASSDITISVDATAADILR